MRQRNDNGRTPGCIPADAFFGVNRVTRAGFPPATSGITAHCRRGPGLSPPIRPGPGSRGSAKPPRDGFQGQDGQARLIVTGWLLWPAVS